MSSPVDQVPHAGRCTLVILDFVVSNGPQPSAGVLNLALGIRLRQRHRSDQCQHGFADDVFRQVFIAVHAATHVPPYRRQIAFAQTLKSHRISFTKSPHEIRIVQKRVSSIVRDSQESRSNSAARSVCRFRLDIHVQESGENRRIAERRHAQVILAMWVIPQRSRQGRHHHTDGRSDLSVDPIHGKHLVTCCQGSLHGK